MKLSDKIDDAEEAIAGDELLCAEGERGRWEPTELLGATSIAARLRRGAGAFLVDNFFRAASRLGRLHPAARPSRHGVEVVRDLAYADDGHPAHKLDLWRPVGVGAAPVVLYVHGGGFRILSKDTHWIMALAFARRGFLVANIDYRLAPKHPFPAALEDAALAYRWLVEHAGAHGGDLAKGFVLAGESAGANLVTSLAVMSSWRRDEPWARAVFDAPARPTAVVAACGMLQVSDPGRFARRKKLSSWLKDRIVEVSEAYLARSPVDARARELADPLVVLERAPPPERPLPPFFLPVGTADPLLDDTRRAKAALDARAVPATATYYEGEPHAFHAFVPRAVARRCWRDTYAFLDGVGVRPVKPRR